MCSTSSIRSAQPTVYKDAVSANAIKQQMHAQFKGVISKGTICSTSSIRLAQATIYYDAVSATELKQQMYAQLFISKGTNRRQYRRGKA